MNGRFSFEHEGKSIPVWFNNYSRLELAKQILPELKGFPAKPEELPILKAIDQLSKENHLNLIRIILWTGLYGQAYGTFKALEYSMEEVAEIIACASEKTLYDLWIAFLQSMGVSLDEVRKAIADIEKKKGTV